MVMNAIVIDGNIVMELLQGTEGMLVIEELNVVVTLILFLRCHSFPNIRYKVKGVHVLYFGCIRSSFSGPVT